MRIKNATRYPTRKLHSVFSAVHDEMAKHEGRHPRWNEFVFDVVYTRDGHGYSGCAHLNFHTATIRLPRMKADPAQTAALVDHELLHSYGYGHRQMPKYDAAYLAGFEWASRFGTLEEVAVRPKPKPNVQAHRHALVLAGIDRWTRKLRSAQSRLRTLRAKDRYYQRALAAKRLDTTPSL